MEEVDTYQYDDSSNEHIKRIETIRRSTEMREKGTMVHLTINKCPVKMFVDLSCERTLLPWDMHTQDMGQLEEANVQFRPYGTETILKCHGAVSSSIEARSGCKQPTNVYVVEGHQAEPLLGRRDALALGIINFD